MLMSWLSGVQIGLIREPECRRSADMRRLTESQYRATVASIFAPDIPM